MNQPCPHCGASMTIWEHRLTPGLVSVLVQAIEFVHAHDKNEFHFQRDLNLTKTEYANAQKLRYHALIAHVDGKPGYWLITARGGQFLRGKVSVPRAVKTFRNRIVEHSKELVDIRQFRNAIPYFESRREFRESALTVGRQSVEGKPSPLFT